MISKTITPLMAEMLRSQLPDTPVTIAQFFHTNHRKLLQVCPGTSRFQIVVNNSVRHSTMDSTEAAEHYSAAEDLYHP
jgi:hypothetical protein